MEINILTTIENRTHWILREIGREGTEEVALVVVATVEIGRQLPVDSSAVPAVVVAFCCNRTSPCKRLSSVIILQL